MKEANVAVVWLSPEQGGRKTRMTENRYITIGRFPEDGPEWPNAAWSVVLEFAPDTDPAASPALAKASFLMPNAPHERLRPGAVFTLHEGLRKVATASVLDE